MARSRTMVVAACGALLVASVAAAQRREASPPGVDKVGVAIAVQVAGQPYQFTGKAACTREPKGYIYGTPAQLWMVEHKEGQVSLSLTFWRPASGAPDMFMLGASLGAKSHVVTTTKGPAGGRVQGSGQVKLALGVKGGTFTIDATTATGGRITGTVKCDAFTAATAEGGH